MDRISREGQQPAITAYFPSHLPYLLGLKDTRLWVTRLPKQVVRDWSLSFRFCREAIRLGLEILRAP